MWALTSKQMDEFKAVDQTQGLNVNDAENSLNIEDIDLLSPKANDHGIGTV